MKNYWLDRQNLCVDEELCTPSYTGSFSFFLSETEAWISPKVEIIEVGDDGIAIKFLRSPIYSDYPCYMEADMDELAERVGTLYLTCPKGQIVLENALLLDSKPSLSGWYLFCGHSDK